MTVAAQRILVTGGAGYVGRALVRRLSGEHAVCVVDSLAAGAHRFTPDELRRIDFRQVDITDAAAVARVLADFAPTTVIHLAAIHFIPACERDPGAAIHTNVVGTANLLAAATPGCRFVFASSGAVYKPDEALHAERTSATEPSDVYGLTKLQGEQFVHYFARLRGLGGVVVRLFNVIGPGETNPHLLPEIVAQLKAGRLPIRVGNDWPKRDYIHVEDAAAGFAAAATRGEVAPGDVVTVNLGTSQQYSVREILDRLAGLIRMPFPVEQDVTRMRAVDRPFLGADIARIREVFGWTPGRSLDDALADLWADPDFSPALMSRYELTGTRMRDS